MNIDEVTIITTDNMYDKLSVKNEDICFINDNWYIIANTQDLDKTLTKLVMNNFEPKPNIHINYTDILGNEEKVIFKNCIFKPEIYIVKNTSYIKILIDFDYDIDKYFKTCPFQIYNSAYIELVKELG